MLFNRNWNRPKTEVDALMELLVSSLNKEISTFKKTTSNFSIGEKDTLPNNCRKKLDHVIKETSQNTGLKLVIALSYSSKLEIINSIKNIAQKVADKTIKLMILMRIISLMNYTPPIIQTQTY